jgi:hypothetical protein
MRALEFVIEARVPSVRDQIIADIKQHGGNVSEYFVRFTNQDKLGFSDRQTFKKTPPKGHIWTYTKALMFSKTKKIIKSSKNLIKTFSQSIKEKPWHIKTFYLIFMIVLSLVPFGYTALAGFLFVRHKLKNRSN